MQFWLTNQEGFGLIRTNIYHKTNKTPKPNSISWTKLWLRVFGPKIFHIIVINKQIIWSILLPATNPICQTTRLKIKWRRSDSVGEFNSETFQAEAVEMGMNLCMFEWHDGNHNILKRQWMLMNSENVTWEMRLAIPPRGYS